MAFLGGTFDATAVEPQGDFTPIAPGEYKVQITSSEMVDNSAKTGSMLKLELEIIEGESAGRKLYDRLNLDNPNDKAVEIAQRTLSAICHAVGKLSVADSVELHMLPMIAVVKVEPGRTHNGKDYGPSNGIKTYKALGNGAAATGGGFKPGASANPAPAADAPAAGKASPWKRQAA
jgi:hypothetical protein